MTRQKSRGFSFGDTRVFHMAKKSKHYLPQEKGKDKLTTINPADKKGPGRNNVKIRDYGKKPAEPDAVHHRHPPHRSPHVSKLLAGCTIRAFAQPSVSHESATMVHISAHLCGVCQKTFACYYNINVHIESTHLILFK